MRKLNMSMGSYQKYPYKKGQKIDGIVILHDDFIKKEDRYFVEYKCRCGNIDYKRLSHLENMKYKACRNCSRKNKYPEQRKIRNQFTNCIHNKWMKSLKDNLIRGNKIILLEITIEDLYKKLEMQNNKCAYTGTELKVLNTYKRDSNASIDRIDSTKNYTYDNIQWILKPINIMKNGLSSNDFIYLCKEVSNFT